MQVSAGSTVLAMVLDTLSGRSPLYRLQSFFEDKDIELLLGKNIDPYAFADHNVARVLDSIYNTGTGRIFSQLTQNAMGTFALNTTCGHYDTTSISVFGDYDWTAPPFQITYGHSKDKRPDLKQFLVEMLCVDRNVPIIGATRDGNSSDKTLNNELLGSISRHMAHNGIDSSAFIYVADSAIVTRSNLERIEETQTHFISRLPATFKECARAIDEAVAANTDQWTDVGILAKPPATGKRPAADYRVFGTSVTLYGVDYRAIVVHSSAHDKRRHKRIDRLLDKKYKHLKGIVKDATGKDFFCQADAHQAAEELATHAKDSYHQIQFEIVEQPKFGRGRPANDRPRIPVSYRYRIKARIIQDAEEIELLRLGAGCFVLLSNVPQSFQKRQWTDSDLLVTAVETLGGLEPAAAIEKAAQKMPSDASISQKITLGLKSVEKETAQAISDFGQMCETDAALPGTIHLIAKYPKDLETALIENIMAGGDSSARGILSGFILGLFNGMGAIPLQWLDEMNAFIKIKAMVGL